MVAICATPKCIIHGWCLKIVLIWTDPSRHVSRINRLWSRSLYIHLLIHSSAEMIPHAFGTLQPISLRTAMRSIWIWAALRYKISHSSSQDRELLARDTMGRSSSPTMTESNRLPRLSAMEMFPFPLRWKSVCFPRWKIHSVFARCLSVREHNWSL